MKKAEIKALSEIMSGYCTKQLKIMMEWLPRIEEERDRTKMMYFWKNFGNAGQRKSFKKYYDNNINVYLTETMVIRWKREVNPSRDHAYASDKLWLDDNGTEVPFTVADVKKVMAAIEKILATREDC